MSRSGESPTAITGAPSRAGPDPFADVDLDRSAVVPLHQQLYTHLRRVLLSSAGAGARLPSTRSLSDRLGVSRNTVVLAYQRLREDGHVEGRAGGGTVVARSAPAGAPADRGPATRCPGVAAARPAPVTSAVPLDAGPVDLVPTATWAGLTTRRLRTCAPRMLLGGDPLGNPALREAVAAHLWTVRGIRTSADRIVVTAGLPAAVGLLRRSLCADRDAVWCEDPCPPRVRAALGGAAVAVPVDDDGFDPDAAVAAAPGAALAVVAPALGDPLRATMTGSRRERLVEHAAATGTWVVEYESETPFLGRSGPPPLLAEYPDAPVVHVGTFDTTLFPQLGVGYCVLPAAAVAPVGRCLAEHGGGPPELTQAVLADFLDHHGFARYLDRVVATCRRRRQALWDALDALPGRPLRLLGERDRGVALTAVFAAATDERAVVADAARQPLAVVGLDAFHAGPARTTGVVLGCGAARPDAVAAAVRVLGPSLRRHRLEP